MRNQIIQVVITIATGLVAGLMTEALTPRIDAWLVEHSLESCGIWVKLCLIALLVVSVYLTVTFYQTFTMNDQRRREALTRAALLTVEYLRTHQLILNDSPPEGEIIGIRSEGLTVPLSDIWRELTPLAAQLKEAIKQAYGFTAAGDIRVSIFIPRKVVDTQVEEDKGKLALFNGGTSYPESKSLTQAYYFLPNRGFVGTCWMSEHTEIGGRFKRRLLWLNKGPRLLVEKDPRWVNMHEREQQDHQFHQLACVPVRDRLCETTVVAVISLDSSHKNTFPRNDPKLLADAIQIASMAIADRVRILYNNPIGTRESG